MTRPRYVVVEDHTGQSGVTLRGAALELWKYRGPEAILAGAAETGKTFACLFKLDALLWKYAGAQAVLCRKVRDTIFPSALQTYLKKVLPETSGVACYGGEKPQWFDYPNGSRLWLAGLDDPGKALSSERDFVYVNQAEELTHDDWQVLTTRATGRAGNAPYGQTFGDCNPGPAHHWIKNRPSLRVLDSDHRDNPTLWDGERWTEQGERTLSVLDQLTGVRKDRLRHGRWVSAEGTVYELDPKAHLIDRSAVPTAVRHIAGVDWGFTNPGALLVFAADADNRLYLVHEVYRTGQLIGWWVERAKEAARRYGVSVFACDPSEPAYIAQFCQAGLYAVKADNDVSAGVQAVQARLALQPDGRPRLYLCRGALAERDEALTLKRYPVSTEQEFDAYSWPKAADGKPVKEVPVDLHNHGLDALRYAVVWADTLGRVAGGKFGHGGRARGASPPRGESLHGDFRRIPRGV